MYSVWEVVKTPTVISNNPVESQTVHIHSTCKVCNKYLECCSIKWKTHILLSQVYYVWQVVKTPTIISNNPASYKKIQCLGKIVHCQSLFSLWIKPLKVFNVASISREIPRMGRRKCNLRPPTDCWRSSRPLRRHGAVRQETETHNSTEVRLHLFSILEHNGNEWSTSRPAHLLPEKKETLCPFYKGAWCPPPKFRSGKQPSFLLSSFLIGL